MANNHSSNVSRDLSINAGQNRSFVHEIRGPQSLGRKPAGSPLSALIGPLTTIKKQPIRLKQIQPDRSESSSLPQKIKPPLSEHRKTPSGPTIQKQQIVSEIIDIDRNADMLPPKYGFLIRSRNIPLQKVINYLIIVVKGLHYSLKCLKPPSLKFIQSKKIMLKDSPISKLTHYQGAGREKTLFLDLDETIVYQCKEHEPADFQIPLEDNQKVSLYDISSGSLQDPIGRSF